MANVIETQALTKQFKGFVAVSNVNLRVAEGSIHGLIGPNGAGKTTCFNLLTKFLEPSTGRMPNMVHAGTYSAVSQYLKAVQAAGTDDADKVTKKLHEMPVDDFFAKGGKVLANGRMVHDMYLFQIKKPEESKGEWDLYKLLATVPGSEAYFTLDKSGCKLTN